MDKVNLCRCNNCDTIMIDSNPQVDAKFYQLKNDICEDFPDKIIEEMDFIKDEESQDQNYFWACPNCQTDDYLTDL